MEINEQYKDTAFYYALDVVDGNVKACQKVIKACQRHLDDLKNISNSNFEFDYFPEKAQNTIDFLEILPDVKTGKTYPLARFQKFIISSLYGWRKKKDHSVRRFRKAMVSVARKNGKTILIAGILLYEFLFGKNPALSRQLFCTANDRSQARIAWTMAKKQLEALRAKDKDIFKATKIVRDELTNKRDESYIRALSRDTGAVDGFEPYVGVLDEYAASKTNEMIELLESGQGQLDNPLILIISTAGLDLNVPMYTIEYKYAAKILDKKTIDDSYFAFIAEQDDEKEIGDLKKFKSEIEKAQKDSVIEEFSNSLTDEKIQEFKDAMANYSVADFKKEVCMAAYEANKELLNNNHAEELIYKNNGSDGDKFESGAIRILRKNKKGGNK